MLVQAMSSGFFRSDGERSRSLVEGIGNALGHLPIDEKLCLAQRK